MIKTFKSYSVDLVDLYLLTFGTFLKTTLLFYYFNILKNYMSYSSSSASPIISNGLERPRSLQPSAAPPAASRL